MKKALTIGELLVTMAIIGIIATLVLPGFLKDYQKQLYTTRLKKTYEMLESAINQACTDNNVSYFYQTPYAQYTAGGTNQQTFLNTYFKKASSVAANPFSANYRTVDSDAKQAVALSNSGFAKLAGGEAVSFYCKWDERCVLRVDVNSTDGPNIAGRDFFTIPIDIMTNKLGDVYNQAGNRYPTGNCTSSIYGYGCLENILQNNWEMTY